jgi:hypothetical protein
MARKQTSDKEVVVSNGAAAAPVRRKAVGPVRKKHTASAVENAVASPLNADVAETVGAAAIASRTEPVYEEIARLAYSYWEARGCQGGSPEEDWVRAEQELRTR